MKTYDVLISEEVAYMYRIKAKDKKEAQEIAMDKHEREVEKDKIAQSIDRCEIIDCEEVKNETNRKNK